MESHEQKLQDWERLLSAERHLQHLIPGTILVGGTAAAIHAGHRVSLDGDHVLEDLRARFDEVLAALEAVAGWQTERVQRPVLILEQLDGILTGIRQLRRTTPLETELVAGLRVPTLPEMARIKAWLLATRNTVRDYLDTVVLFERLAAALPQDRTEIDLSQYRGLQPPWDDWQHLAACGRRWAPVVARAALQEEP